MALRCEGQTLQKKYSWALAQRYFFSGMALGMALGMAIGMALGMTLAQRYDWSGTPLQAGLSPAAAHLTGLRPCRRPRKK